MIVIEHLLRIASTHPQRLAFVSNDISYTYGETAALVNKIAAGMRLRGCPPGTPIAVLSPNDPSAFICVLAILRAGAAWVPINQRNGAVANAEFLRRTRCEWLFYHGALADDASVIRENLPNLQNAVQIDGTKEDNCSLEFLVSSVLTTVVEMPEDPDRVCTIVGTGGTTGLPKAVTWTESTWATLLATTTGAMPCDVVPVHLCVAPMTHAAGVLAMMLMPVGATNITLDRTDPLEIMKRIEADRVTHLYLPPTLLYLMLAHPELHRFDYSSLKYFLVTAAPVAPHRLREAVQVFGPVMAQCYGQSEAPMICTFFSPQEIAVAAASNDLDKLSSCGRSTASTEVGVMAPSGEILKDGGIGEIVVRGEMVMRGYLDDRAATEEVSTHGWHRTGDVGRIDQDGFVYIVDRKKDMIISGGFNVFPAEIEKLILTHPAVQDCAVIGVPDEKWGEAVKAVIELKQDATATESEILALCRQTLGGVKTPKSAEFRVQLPRSPVGKVLKRELRAQYWVGQTRSV